MIRDMIKKMKDELLHYMIRNVEILENSVFQKEKDNNKLTEQVVQLIKTIEIQKEENNDLRL